MIALRQALFLLAILMVTGGARGESAAAAAGAEHTAPSGTSLSAVSEDADLRKGRYASRATSRQRGAEALQARKAEMVRRMFWIMIAHR